MKKAHVATLTVGVFCLGYALSRSIKDEEENTTMYDFLISVLNCCISISMMVALLDFIVMSLEREVRKRNNYILIYQEVCHG